MNISENFIRQCSLTLGQFDSESVDLLVTLFHHQNACLPLIRLSHNFKENFQNLLTSKRDDDEIYNDTPLTRIELAIMIHFKQKYLSNTFDQNQLKSPAKFSIDDELNLAYCFLLAQIDDRLSKDQLDELKFLLGIKQSVECLFDIYEKLGVKFANLFSILLDQHCFEKKLVVADQLIRNFQIFIQRYEEFLITFAQHYKLLTENVNNYTQTDAILTVNDTQEISSFMSKLVGTNREQLKSPTPVPVEQPTKIPVSRPVISQPIPSSSNGSRKGLCVIINITAFISAQSIHTPPRSGSNKDVDLIKVIFTKLNFTVLECKFDFKKIDVDRALNYIDDKSLFGDFDCLVMFIMSHGLLHSFFTADSQEVVIRDIIRRYADSSPSTIWAGKPRMFFIQACRSLWPEHVPSNNREGVQQSDLSPRMLVAYSCSANQAAKRIPNVGSIFIQIFGIMLLRYSHLYPLQHILDCTARFVAKRDEYYVECKKTRVNIQRPEYIEREFSSNFRLSNNCLFNEYQSWTNEKQVILCIPLRIWQEIYDLIYIKPMFDSK